MHLWVLFMEKAIYKCEVAIPQPLFESVYIMDVLETFLTF